MDDKIFQILFLVNTISSCGGYSLEDCYFQSNENVMNMNMQLLIEIIELLEKGYSYETIFNAIQELKFENENFTEEEKEYLKKDAIRSLNIKYKQKNKGD